MSNEKLIERLRYPVGASKTTIREAADALELADKRIAELECILAGQQALGYLPKGIVTGTVYGLTVDELYQKIVQADEAERKLAIAVEALRWAYDTATDHDDRLPFDWAIYCEHLYQTLAQIGGEDGN